MTVTWSPRSAVLRIGVPLAVVVGVACSDAVQGPPQATGFSAAYGIWTPGPGDSCTKETHDRYAVVGPDGKLYPTWHPPVDPETGCTFGHEHGRDPRGSSLYGMTGPVPFGYANEQLDTYDPTLMRHEDHVGHKIEWANDIPLHFGSNAASQLFDIRCDVFVKLHQGTHSKDAYTNNLHELAYHIRCTDGTELHVTLLTAIGTPGEFSRGCDADTEVVVGPATPAGSPDGGGRRLIPDRSCASRLLVPLGQRSDWGLLRESWQTSSALVRDDGHRLASFNPYFQVILPSRYYFGGQPNNVGRPIDLCYEVGPSGERAQGGPCDESTNHGADSGVAFDDPRSQFDGAARLVDINSTIISNRDGPEVWYTDPLGRHGRRTPFPGSVRQFIAHIDNDLGSLIPSGPGIGQNRAYSGQGVHSPN
jgi:hypothetical protein